MSNNTKVKNSKVMKRSIFTVVFAACLVAVLITANVFATTIAQKYPTTVDLTEAASNTLTTENIEFIKGIDKPVEIIVCATREGYTGSEMTNYVYNAYYVQENSTPDNYFNQTITLLESYPKYNKNISVSYIDPQTPEFKELESNYEIDIVYGDILVRCTRPDENGKEHTYESVITFNDIYELYDPSGSTNAMYGSSYYSISASDIETRISSAMFTVSASGHKKVAVLTKNSAKESYSALVSALENYNFEFLELDGVVSATTLKDIDTILLTSPVSDLSEAELDAIDVFLENDGNYQKNFMVFGSTSSPNTPNLNEFLEEWGIKVEDGMAYETNSTYRLSDGQSMMLFNKKANFTKSINESELSYYCGDNVAIKSLYETQGSRTSHVLMSTSEYAVKAPKGVSGYTASSTDELGEMPVVIVTQDAKYNDNYDEISSHVAYFASTDFIDEVWTQFTDNGNMDFAIAVANIINGRAAASMYFLPKVTSIFSMTTPFTDGQYTAIYIVSIFVIPAILLIGGVVVWFRRRNR